MAFRIRRVDYFYANVRDPLGEAYQILSQLAGFGVNLLAFTAVPFGPARTQLTLFPDDDARLLQAGEEIGLVLDGPHPALLVQGDDELGALASVHQRLDEAKVKVYASSGVTDGRGSYGYIVYVRPEQYQRAAEVLGV